MKQWWRNELFTCDQDYLVLFDGLLKDVTGNMVPGGRKPQAEKSYR